MTRILDLGEAKLRGKLPQLPDRWERGIKRAGTEAYVKGIAVVTGLSEGEVAASPPARAYGRFVDDVSIYKEKYQKKLEVGIKYWKENYINAFRSR